MFCLAHAQGNEESQVVMPVIMYTLMYIIMHVLKKFTFSSRDLMKVAKRS